MEVIVGKREKGAERIFKKMISKNRKHRVPNLQQDIL